MNKIQDIQTEKINVIGYDKNGKEYRGVDIKTKHMIQKRYDILSRALAILANVNNVPLELIIDFKFEPMGD